MKWIELHTRDNTVLINTDHISDIWSNDGQCTIWLDTIDEDVQSHFTPTENYDEIKRLILMDENTTYFQEALDNIHNLFGNNT